MGNIKIDLERELKWQMVFTLLSIQYPNADIQLIVDKTNEFIDGNK